MAAISRGGLLYTGEPNIIALLEAVEFGNSVFQMQLWKAPPLRFKKLRHWGHVLRVVSAHQRTPAGEDFRSPPL